MTIQDSKKPKYKYFSINIDGLVEAVENYEACMELLNPYTSMKNPYVIAVPEDSGENWFLEDGADSIGMSEESILAFVKLIKDNMQVSEANMDALRNL